MSQRLRVAAIAAALVILALALPATANAVPTWAPAASADVRPGDQTSTEGAQCTSNFVFYDAADNVYLGQAAHCSGTGEATDTNGCEAGTLPEGTPVEVDGASRPGTIVYSSWVAMQRNGESDESACAYNDFALVRLDPADAAEVNPTIPFWGGPTGTDTDGTTSGERVLSYGNSSLRAGVTTLSPKEGTSLGTAGDGWTHDVYTVTPGVPGDSGSAFLDRQGRGFGVLSTLALAPFPASNGVSDLDRMVRYMEANGGPDVTLATGTEPFRGPRLP